MADEADVDIAIDIHDVRNNPGGSDYVGRLLATSQLQITDRKNADETPEPATVQQFPLNMPVDCVNDGVATSGGDCALDTSVDTLIPGAVIERQFAVWELGQFQVKDAGPNGTGYALLPAHLRRRRRGGLPAPGQFSPRKRRHRSSGGGTRTHNLRLTAGRSAD